MKKKDNVPLEPIGGKKGSASDSALYYVTKIKGVKMRRSIIIALLLFGLDAFVLNQGVIALITLIIVVPIMITKALIRWKDTPLLKKRLTVCGIYLLMSILILTANAINNRIARSRAEVLIAALEKYKGKNNEYPEKLSDLVPDFINEVPVAKYALMSNRFFYITAKDSHLLFYVSVPPFGRPTYNLERKKWTYANAQRDVLKLVNSSALTIGGTMTATAGSGPVGATLVPARYVHWP